MCLAPHHVRLTVASRLLNLRRVVHPPGPRAFYIAHPKRCSPICRQVWHDAVSHRPHEIDLRLYVARIGVGVPKRTGREAACDRRLTCCPENFNASRHGNVVLFKMNPSQEKLLDDLHFLNIILKARQMGFSTFILLLALDCCIFNSNFAAGLIADTKKNAQNLLERIKYAYEKLPLPIQRTVQIVSDNSTEIEFSNGSGVEVGVSLRSGTKNFLHISEYGKICAKTPDKAKEVKSGSLNTLASGQLGFIESTAEGRGGDFYDKVQIARKILDAGREPGEMDYRFHFFAWWEDASYQLSKPRLTGWRRTRTCR